MKSSKILWLKRLVMTSALAALPQLLLAHGPSLAFADGAPPSVHGAADRHDACGAPSLPSEMPGPGLPPGEGPELPPELNEFPPPQRITLSEAQQDAYFELTHAQIPVQRALAKKAGKALDELRRIGRNATFNAKQARTLADALAQANAQLAYNRAELDSKLRALLSAEQRQQLDAAPGECAAEQLPAKGGKDVGHAAGER